MGVQHYLGLFTTEIDAAVAFDNAAISCGRLDTCNFKDAVGNPAPPSLIEAACDPVPVVELQSDSITHADIVRLLHSCDATAPDIQQPSETTYELQIPRIVFNDLHSKVRLGYFLQEHTTLKDLPLQSNEVKDRLNAVEIEITTLIREITKTVPAEEKFKYPGDIITYLKEKAF